MYLVRTQIKYSTAIATEAGVSASHLMPTKCDLISTPSSKHQLFYFLTWNLFFILPGPARCLTFYCMFMFAIEISVSYVTLRYLSSQFPLGIFIVTPFIFSNFPLLNSAITCLPAYLPACLPVCMHACMLNRRHFYAIKSMTG